MDTNKSIIEKSLNRALNGGISGSIAMSCQVLSLMWLRTTMNYQYRYGTTTSQAIKTLYNQGGIVRFYRGLGPALFQGPLSRFGDTAANMGMLEFLNNNESTKNMSTASKTMMASVTAALWRINLMPIDTVKTSMQVNGKEGFNILKNKVKTNGFRTLYHGTMGTFTATYMGHFPWFVTFNYLDEKLPKYEDTFKKFGRNALIGFCSSTISDTVSNSMRVLKTTRQTSETPISYMDAAKNIIKTDGIIGFMGRGLKTRLIANGLQGMMFTVILKSIMEKLG